jgi:CheY-like chemotaxis protein
VATLCDILVVEDDAGIRDALVDTLEDEGYRVTAAANGVDAFRHLQHDPRPCLILLDLMMPVMTGWEFLTRIRHQQDLATIPIVILSAVAEFQRGRPSFADLLMLPKPVSVDELLAVVQQTCQQQSHIVVDVPPAMPRMLGTA